MIQKSILLFLCASGLSISAALGFSTDPSATVRNFNSTSTVTNSLIVVTATFTNGGGLAVRGFCYAEQIPSGLNVTALSLRLNGLSVTNYTFESGLDGDVYPGCTPYRWVLERPPGFTENQPVSANVTVQIQYSITSPVAGSFNLQQFSRAGYNAANTNASFGHSESNNAQSVSFTVTSPTNQPPVANADSNSVPAGTVLTVHAPGVLGNDTDAEGNPLNAVPVSGVAHGTLSLSTNGAFIYTPVAGYSGPDSFTYKANDGTANSAVAMVSLTVTPSVPTDPGKFDSLLLSADGQVHLTLRALAGQTFVIQASTNLGSWNDLGTVTLIGATAEFVDVNATHHPSRCYRAKLF